VSGVGPERRSLPARLLGAALLVLATVWVLRLALHLLADIAAPLTAIGLVTGLAWVAWRIRRSRHDGW
jgi:hypothetical protein